MHVFHGRTRFGAFCPVYALRGGTSDWMCPRLRVSVVSLDPPASALRERIRTYMYAPTALHCLERKAPPERGWQRGIRCKVGDLDRPVRVALARYRNASAA